MLCHVNQWHKSMLIESTTKTTYFCIASAGVGAVCFPDEPPKNLANMFDILND
jgi:hypothetical protein